MQSAKLFRDRLHRFIQRVWKNTNGFPAIFSLRLIVYRQGLLRGIQGQPNILTMVVLADPESLLEKLDLSFCRDTPNRMHLPFAYRQRVGYLTS